MEYDNSIINDPHFGFPKKKIFADYSFLLGYGNEKISHMLAREELKNLIVRNGGTVTFAPPVEGLKVSVTVWRTSSKTNTHLCHHSSIYDAVKRQEFNFAKHLKRSSQDDCVTGKIIDILPIPFKSLHFSRRYPKNLVVVVSFTDYIGITIEASDSVKSRATHTAGAKKGARVGKASSCSSLRTGASATNAIESNDNVNRTKATETSNQGKGPSLTSI